ncbi:diguanylate cyclase [Ammonifex degensii]|uniref:diguanylate cyclase n=1 Tax=Ammonifex degensii TaxID=42838 RepID=UPI001FE1127C|nr:diguanylate cyclase [Ammonifex degensii]
MLLATGIEELDEGVAALLAGRGGFEVAGECYYREGLTLLLREKGADAVVLSPRLPGQVGLPELVKELRMAGVRVVLLPGSREDGEAVELARKAVALGVYDIVWDPVKPQKVVYRLENPAGLKDAGVEPDFGAVEYEPPPAPVREDKEEKKASLLKRLFPFRRARKSGEESSHGREKTRSRRGKKREAEVSSPVPVDAGDARETVSTPLQEGARPGAGGEGVAPPRQEGERPVSRTREGGGVLVLAPPEVAARLARAGFRVVSDPRDAGACVCAPDKVPFAPEGVPVLVLKTGRLSDLLAASQKPSARPVDPDRLEEELRAALGGTPSPGPAPGEVPGGARVSPDGAPPSGPAPERAPGVGPAGARDPLTGLHTRDLLASLVPGEVCSVVFVDLDGFKRVNDTYGHDEGDRVLALFGECLRRRLRERDLAVRWGGDEFVLVLPDTHPGAAERVVEDLRREWERVRPYPVGFSAGTAAVRGSLEEAVREADRRMYAEKAARKAREEALGAARPRLAVLPGRKGEDGFTLPEHGVVYVVCPGEPPAAGRLAASLAGQAEGAALVCASPTSTAALALGMRPEDLVTRDWRVPGSDAPVTFGGVVVWPVDPAKFLDVRDALPNALVSQVRHRFRLVVVDCGGDLGVAAGAPRDAVVLALKTGRPAADWALDQWLKSYGANAVVLTAGQAVALEGHSGGFVGHVQGRPHV